MYIFACVHFFTLDRPMKHIRFAVSLTTLKQKTENHFQNT